MPSIPLRQSYAVDVIIRGADKVHLTRRLLRSLEANPPGLPWQIIYVDGGSDKQDIAQLVTDHPAVVTVALPYNHGAVRHINLGLSQALMSNAEFILLLDNDCQIPADAGDWLGRWLEYFKDGRVAAVGAVSDKAPGIQQMDGPQAARMLEDVPILDNFALMLRKAAIAEIGLFDERFEPGLCEDLDYLVRLHEKGWQARVAADVWIAHRGSETLSKFDVGALMSANLTKLQDKWGADRLRQYGLQVVETKDLPPDTRKISLLVPTLHRPEKLARMLESVRPLVEADGNIEVVVAPMIGSVKVPEYPWVVVAPRPESERGSVAGFNWCYQHATGDILVVGGDDVTYDHPDFFQVVRQEVAQLPDGEGMVDSRVNNVECLQAITRGFIEKEFKGVFMPGGYRSWFANTEQTARAMRAGKHRLTNRAMVSSTNPILDGSPKDATYLEGEKWHEQDRTRFTARMAAGFPDSWE